MTRKYTVAIDVDSFETDDDGERVEWQNEAVIGTIGEFTSEGDAVSFAEKLLPSDGSREPKLHALADWAQSILKEADETGHINTGDAVEILLAVVESSIDHATLATAENTQSN